jgi:nucleoside 2-deoxyribosyltransferase
MNEADLLIANMMPFRGVSADVGTAFEIGYVYAQDKPVFGYGRDDLAYFKRVLQSDENAREDERSDAQGMRIEDIGLSDNLMLVCATRRFGVEIVPSFGEWDDLTAFEQCIRLVADRLQISNRRHRSTRISPMQSSNVLRHCFTRLLSPLS